MASWSVEMLAFSLLSNSTNLLLVSTNSFIQKTKLVLLVKSSRIFTFTFSSFLFGGLSTSLCWNGLMDA